METSILEVHPLCYSISNLHGSADGQRLSEDGVGKYAGSVRVPTTVEITLSFHGEYCCEPVPY